MRGMADASGADYKKILGVHMIGEVTKGSCSMFGAWGTATASTGALLQLRALDWDVDGPFKNFPQITVYHSTNASDGNSFANVGWTGWLGSITGISDKRMAMRLFSFLLQPTLCNTLSSGNQRDRSVISRRNLWQREPHRRAVHVSLARRAAVGQLPRRQRESHGQL